ncbi:hypothetical protein J2W39_003011 [Variovorax paradoxus]|uniref:Large polyvalent protein-associated domain-containing protein n=1 Tax=Variovorax paradoxus TaxID=34073 RepID=A0AAW8EGT8_VARPD|nr:LPD7 domain-containing protein [Variovorax paradoxus]MDP9971769.1 hypothetical protein [Variovorax paradoxus]
MSTDSSSGSQAPNGIESTAPWYGVGSIQGDAPAAGRGHTRVPDAIERRYLRIDNRYFFPDRTLAFIDDGGRLRVRTENREVLHSVVAIAETRGWRVIELTGTETFRQGMWHEAALRGIEARGYEPTPTEILQVQRALKKRGPPSHENGRRPIPASLDREAATVHHSAVPAEADPSASLRPHKDEPQDRRFERGGPRPPVRGMLVAAASAPYQFDPTQRMSFYVTVRVETGARTIWGTDLERALAESTSQPRIGDQVVLTQRGTRPVNVRVATRNAEGELVGEKKIVAQRAHWSIETSDHLRAMERHAMRIRTGKLLSDAAQGPHPELATAAADLKLAEQYAQRVTSDPSSQQHLVQLIRDRIAEALAQGRAIHLPDRLPRVARMHARQRTARSQEDLSRERV